MLILLDHTLRTNELKNLLKVISSPDKINVKIEKVPLVCNGLRGSLMRKKQLEPLECIINDHSQKTVEILPLD